MKIVQLQKSDDNDFHFITYNLKIEVSLALVFGNMYPLHKGNSLININYIKY